MLLVIYVLLLLFSMTMIEDLPEDLQLEEVDEYDEFLRINGAGKRRKKHLITRTIESHIWPTPTWTTWT